MTVPAASVKITCVHEFVEGEGRRGASLETSRASLWDQRSSCEPWRVGPPQWGQGDDEQCSR
jgi:hypothetical protein